MACSRTEFPPVELVCGDDLTLEIPLTDPETGEAVTLSEGDRLAALAVCADRTIELAAEKKEGAAAVYMDCDTSRTLGELRGGGAHICVHVLWENGGRSTVRFVEDPEDIDSPESFFIPLRFRTCHPA